MAKKAARKSRRAGGGTKKGAATRTRTRTRPADLAPGEDRTWTYSRFALWSRRWDDPDDAKPSAVLLHHPTAPFPDDPLIIASFDDGARKEIQKLALDYLRYVNALTDLDYPPHLPDQWLDELELDPQVQDPTFTWLPISWPSADAEFADPSVSFRIARGPDPDLPDASVELNDEAVILLASEWRRPLETDQNGYLGSEFGIRVVASVRPGTGGQRELRIIGMTASLPFGPYRTSGVSTKRWASQIAFNLIMSNKHVVAAEIAEQLGLQNASVHVRGVRIAETDKGVQVEWRCTGASRPTDG